MMNQMMAAMIGSFSPEEREKLLLKLMPSMLEGESFYLIMDNSVIELSKRNRVSSLLHFFKEMLKRITFYDVGSLFSLLIQAKSSLMNKVSDSNSSTTDAAVNSAGVESTQDGATTTSENLSDRGSTRDSSSDSSSESADATLNASQSSAVQSGKATSELTTGKSIITANGQLQEIPFLEKAGPMMELMMPKMMGAMMGGMMSKMMPVMHKMMMPMMVKVMPRVLDKNPQMKGVVYECMNDMCPQHMHMIIPDVPKSEREDFALKLMNIIAKSTTKEMTTSEKKEFNEKARTKIVEGINEQIKEDKRKEN
jgi:hypothetical protein